MIRYAIAYFASLIVFLAMDFAWISSAANSLYRPVMKDMLLTQFRPAPAVVFYLLYTGGVIFFAVLPALRDERWIQATAYGAVLGLVAYGTYNLTNFAILKNWDTKITVADMAWGTFATAVAATAGYFAAGLAERMLR